MGQGYSLTTLSAGSAGIDVPELADITYEKTLGTARFMKSIRARHHDGLVFVKVVMKPYPSMKLDPYARQILAERKALGDVPNALSYQRILETSTNGYLIRQYLYSSLYDRLRQVLISWPGRALLQPLTFRSTRPFLEDIEKKWLSFQLLCALRDCHARSVYHGDIKTENTLVTSWNWLYLSDFSSSFKPTYLPEDNPADFSYYFDTSGRRTCYLAPERFLTAGEKAEGKGGVNWAMDIFSAGCVIAELFLEAPIFSLSQLYKYRKGEYDPTHSHLDNIEDKDIRELVSHMIQVEPEARYSADEYLNFWRRKAFPEYFFGFLHQYMGLITDPSSGRAAVTSDGVNLGEADDRINRVYYDFDKISYFLGYDEASPPVVDRSALDALYGNGVIPVEVDIPNNCHEISSVGGRRTADDGTLIFLTLVVSSMRSTARATGRLRGCDLLLAFAERITDEAKLDRVLPYVVTLLNDHADVVKMAAIRTLTQLMAMVRVVSPVNAYVFPEYILPRLQQFIPSASSRPRPVVQATYASCLATLAITSSRFLDMMQSLRADGSLPTADPEAEDGVATETAYQTLFDVARSDLLDHFETHTKALLTDGDASVRRAFLGSVSSLCVFFGSSKANDVILSHLNTFLNDKDWMLRSAFFETIVGVAAYVGGTSLEEYILPLMVQALTDPEEFVVEKVIRSFANMALLGLFQRSKTWELIDIVVRFTMHPNLWIRAAAASFVSSATSFLSLADRICIVAPLLQPYLKSTVADDFSEVRLLDTLHKPLSRPVFDLAVSWALRVDRGVFWRPAQQQRTFSFGSSSDSMPQFQATKLGSYASSKVLRNDEDDQWLNRLRNIGMGPDDEWKLLVLREYIWRMAPSKPKEGPGTQASHLNSVITLKQLDMTPQTIFFDDKQQQQPSGQVSPRGGESEEPAAQDVPKTSHTITDALLDASMTIDDSLARRKRSYANSRKAREPARSTPMSPQAESLDSRHNSSHSTSPAPSSSKGKEIASPRHGSSQGSDAEATKRPGSLKVPTVNGVGGVSSDETSTAADSASDAIPTMGGRHRPMRHKSSAFNLMSKKDAAKSVPETSTTSTNAFGKVEGPFRKEAAVRSPLDMAGRDRASPPPTRFRASHSYEGRDPSVLKLLNSVYLENFPSDAVEFGPLVAPISRRQRIKRSSGVSSEAAWRPEGNVVATFGEHTGPINRVVVAPDHAFFITGSDDGTVRVWDAGRLERNVAHRSRQTHRHAPGAKVKALCFVENTHCFVSAATDGSVHIVKAEATRSGGGGGGATRYGKLRVLKTHWLEEGEYAVWLEHFKADNHSLLLMATNMSRVVALDLRTMTEVYRLRNPVHHGTPTCFCVDKKHAWLVLGTSHGVLDLWDLRFRVRLKAWGLQGATPIHRLSIHPLKGRGKWICVAGGTGRGEVTVWDVEKTQCREAYRVGGSGKDDAADYEAWKVDEERPEEMLGRFATALEPTSGGGGGVGSVDRGIRAFVAGLDAVEDGRGSRYGFLVTGGSDRKVRFWDMARVEGSMVVSGLDADEVRPSFGAAQPTPALTVNTERMPSGTPSAANARVAAGGGAGRRGAGRVPRSTVISLQQQQLLKSHLDAIQDVALLELPYGMTVSVDRSGVVYVFQ
ncbi:MAG: Serine/threonine-protein kinase [Thelocarpon impressellum]|nr:MAG: Serine/threonine-protein kinase [Thelocarpon impressellum]